MNTAKESDKNWVVRCSYKSLSDPKSLKLHPKNPNKHPDAQIDRLIQILQYQGWRYPIKVSLATGFITSGHGRLLAALKAGQTIVPVDFQEYESEAQEFADTVSDNSIASWAELDLALITNESLDLGPDFDLDLLGLKEIDILGHNLLDDEQDETEQSPKYILEATFPNEMELHDIKDELLSRGYLVKVK